MKVKDADILIVPGYTNSGPGIGRAAGRRNCRRRAASSRPNGRSRCARTGSASVAKAVNEAERPVVIVAHSLGIAGRDQCHPAFPQPVAGAFLVAPPDVANAGIRPKHLMTFGPYPRDPLPFPSITIASRNDPFCAFEVAEDIAAAWGSLFIDAGEAGHHQRRFRHTAHGPKARWPSPSS